MVMSVAQRRVPTVTSKDPRGRQDRPPKADKRGRSSLQNFASSLFTFFDFVFGLLVDLQTRFIHGKFHLLRFPHQFA